MNTTQRGFIPLIAIFILGAVGITGVTIAVLSNNKVAEISNIEEVLIPEKWDVSEENNKDSAIDTDQGDIEQPQAVLKEPETQVSEVIQSRIEKIEISQETATICKEIETIKLDKKYVIVDEIKKICDDITSEVFDSKSELSKYEVKVGEKWKLLTLSKGYEADDQEDVITSEVVEKEEEEYDLELCLSDKKKLVENADQDYLQWYDDWQEERYTLDSCYNTEPTPYCDKKMTEINIEWQEKLKEIMSDYYAKLDSCRDSDKHFHDVSEYISSPY